MGALITSDRPGISEVPKMLVPTELMVYVKTTETCQLDCKHCFTNGKNGRNIYFDPVKTIDWFKRMREALPDIRGGSVAFHGGEPMLAPISTLRQVWDECKDLWPNVWWSMTTNLTYKIDHEKALFFQDVLRSFGTSWDLDIRFSTQNQFKLWRDNVKTMLERGHEITLMVSVSKALVKWDVRAFLDFIVELGVHHVHIERITPNGSAILNDHIMPTNKELDEWFVKLWEATVEGRYYEKFTNLFFMSVLSSFVTSTHSGCRCRACEQKIFTINADGSIGGCPNGAVDRPYATLDTPIYDLLMAEGRTCEITTEMQRNPICYTCPVYDTCNGDCHQLAWQGDVCAAPKSLMELYKRNKDTDQALYQQVLGTFMGKE